MQKEQIAEWKDNPVTRKLLDLVVSQIKEIQVAKGECFHPFQPERTQEIMAGLNGCEDTWEIVQSLLEGDWEYFDEEDDEPERDIPTT